MKTPAIWMLGLVLTGAILLEIRGQETAAPAVGADSETSGKTTLAEEIAENAKALKYHSVLVKRPSSGYLFDRFFAAWLEGGSVEGLKMFLEQRSTAAEAGTGDRLLLAFFHVKQGEDNQALSVFAKALEADPGNAEAWLEKARAEARTLDFDSALADLKKADEAGAAEDDEQMAEIGQLRGRLLVRLGRSEEALEVWRALLAARADDEDLHEDVIELLVDEGLYDEAIATAKKLAEATADPYQKVQRQLTIGDLHQRAGNREEALAAYSGALGKTGHGTWIEREILAQIEQLFRREDDIDGLSIYLEDLLREDGKRMALRQRRASALVELGEDDLAIEAWKEILELTPGERAIREAYVAVLAKMERFGEAVAQMKALSELHADDGELKVALAELQHAAGGDEAEAAAATVMSFLDGSDKSEYAHLRAARLLQRFEHNDQAEEVYGRLLVAFPDSVGAKETFANFLHDLKRRDEALKIWRELAAANDVGQVVRVGRALAARGEAEEAFALVRDRFDDLKNEKQFLAQLVELALRAKETDEAFDWVRRQLLLVESGDDLVDVTGQALLVVRQTGEAQKRIEEMQAEAADSDGLSVAEVALLSELLNQAGEFKAALAALDEISGEAAGRDEEDRLLALAQKSRLYVLRKDWAGAAESLRVAVELPGGRKSSTVQMLVDLYQRAAMTEEALHWISEWKKISPGGTGPWLREATVRLTSGDIDTGLKTLRAAARRFEDSEEIRLKLADALIDSGKLVDAERIYWQLYDEAEDSLKKLNWAGKLGELASSSGRLDQLIDLFQERKRRNRGSVVPLLALAAIYQVDDRYEERREAILEASRLQPNDIGLLHQLAGIDEAEGNLDGALKSLNAALEIDSSGRTRQRIVRLHFLSGEYEKGLEALQAGSQGGLAAADPYLVEEVWASIVRTGEWERAASFLRPFLAAHPENYRLQYLYAVALEEGEDPAAARDAFLALLDFDKEVPPPASANQNTNQQRYIMYAGSYYNDPADLERARREMERTYPAEAIAIQELRSAETKAYHYRQGRGEGRIYGFGENRRHYYGGWGAAGAGSTLVLPPPTVEELRTFVFPHLIKISRTLAENEAASDNENSVSAEMAELAKRHGYPELLLEWEEFTRDSEELPQEEQQALFSRFMKQHPDSEVVHALWLMGWMSRGESEDVDSLAEAQQVFEIFREDRPALAFFAALTAVNVVNAKAPSDREEGEAEVVRKKVDQALTLLPAIDFVPTTCFRSLYSALNSDLSLRLQAKKAEDGNEDIAKPLLSDEQVAVLEGLLAKWGPEISERYSAGQQSGWFRMSLLSLTALKGDMKGLIEGLEAEMADHQEKLKESGGAGASQLQNQQTYDPYTGRSYGNVMVTQPLTFPPPMLPELPAMVAAYLGPNRSGYYGAANWREEDNLKAVAKLLPQVGDPTLRLMLAHLVGEDGDDVKMETVEELVQADPPTASGLMLAAAYASTTATASLDDNADKEVQKKAAADANDKASTLLEKARHLTTLKPIVNYIDAALVGLGTGAEDGSIRFENGKAAALRIRSVLKPNQSSEVRQLAQVLRGFGLDKEASRLSLSLARAQSANSRSNSPGSTALSAMTQAQDPQMLAAKLKQLVEQDKRDTAVTTAVRQIKLIASGLLGEESSYLEYQLRDLREELEAASLIDEIIETATPKEGAKLVERVQFAALCEAVGDREKAAAAYQKLIEERPRDDALRLRLIVLLIATDPEQAFEELADLKSPTMLARIGQSFASRLNYAETIAEKISIGELTLNLFEARRDDFAEGQLYWMTNIHNELTGDIHSDNLRLPSLLTKWKKEDYDNYDGYTEEIFDKWMKKRAELHARFCETMMTVPMQASHGFTSHAAVRSAAGDSLESLAERASEVIAVMEQPAFHGIGYSYSPTGSSWGGSGDREKQLPIRGPIETLVAHAFESDNRALIYDDLLPELEKDTKKKTLADGIRAYADLYFCDAEKFGQAIDDIGKIVRSYGSRMSIRLAAEAFQARDIDFNFAAKLKEILKSPAGRNNGIEDVLPDLMVATAEREGPNAAMDLMEVYAEQMLGPGPAETRRAYIKKHYVPNSWSGNTPNGDIHSFEEFIGNCGRYPQLVFPALRIASELRLGTNGRIYQLEYPFTNSSYSTREDFVTAWLEGSPLRQPIAEFDPMSAASFQRISQNGRHTVIGAMLYNLGRVSEEKRKPIQDYIDASGDPASAPFGVRLISSRWEKNPSLAAAKIFHQAAAEIREMPEDHQVLLAGLAADLIDPDQLPSDMDGTVAESWQWYEELAGAGADDQLEEFLAADSASDLGIRDYQIDDHAETLIKRVIGKDVDKALAAFIKALELLDIARTTGGYRTSYSGGRTVGGELLDDVSQAASPIDALRFEMGVLASKEIAPVTIFSQPKRDRIGPKLLGDARNKVPKVQLEKFQEVFAELEKNLSADSVADAGAAKATPAVGHVLAMPVFYGFFNNCKAESLPDILKWIDQQIAAAEGAHEFLLAARTAVLQVQAQREFAKIPSAERKKKRADSNPAADEWFARILRDQSLQANLRLSISYNAIDKSLPRVGDDLVAAAAQLLVQSWNSDTPVVDGQAQPIVEEWIARENLPDREKLGRAIATAFQTRYLSGRAPLRLQGNPDSRLILAMVKLNLGNGNTASANQILSRFDQRFSDFTEPFALLVRAGEYASAARLLRKNQEKVGASYGSLTWDAELAAAMPPFLESITRTETRLLGHALLAAAPEPQKGATDMQAETKEAPLESRADRLAEVAGLMAQSHDEVSNSLIREQILRLIGLEPQAVAPAAELYAAELAEINLASLFKIDQSNTRSRKLTVIETALLHSLMKGEPEPFASEMVAAAPAPASSSYYKRQFMNKAVRLPHKAIVESGHDPELFSKLLPAWSKILLEVPMSDQVGPAKTIMGALIFDAAECDRLDEFYAWLEGHDKKSRDRLVQNIRDSGAGFYKAAVTVYQDQDRTLDDKQALLERWFARPELTKTGIGLGWSNFIAAMNNRFISVDDIVERGAAMAEKSPRRGQAWADVASAHDRKKMHQEALAFWNRAIEVAQSQKREAPAHRFLFGKAGSLSKAGQQDKARAALEKVMLKHVPKHQRKAYDALRKELKMKSVSWPKEEQKN